MLAVVVASDGKRNPIEGCKTLWCQKNEVAKNGVTTNQCVRTRSHSLCAYSSDDRGEEKLVGYYYNFNPTTSVHQLARVIIAHNILHTSRTTV